MELAAMMCLSEPLTGQFQIAKATFIGSPNYIDQNKTRQKGVVYILKTFMENTVETLFQVIPVENFSKRSTNFSTLGDFLQLL